MKVLFVFNSSVKLNQRNLTDVPTDEFLAELSSFKGIDICLFGFISAYNFRNLFFKTFVGKYKVIGLNKNCYKILRYVLILPIFIISIIKCDFVYFYYPCPVKLLIPICWLLKKKYAIHVRGQIGIYSMLSLFIYKKSSFVSTISKQFSEEINNRIGSNKAFYLERPLIQYTFNDILREKKTSPNKYNILYLGRVVYDKGIRELLEAYLALPKYDGVKLSLHIVGDGTLLEEVKEKVDLCRRNDVFFHGAVYDKKLKACLYTQADLFVLPSYHEGFPQTLLESMVFATPIITTFVGAIPSLMQNGVNCLEIKPKSVDDIIEKLNYAINNRETMIKYSEASTELIVDMLNPNKPTHAFVFHDLINRNDINSLEKSNRIN